MAYTLTVSTTQMKKAYSTFCNGWIDSLTSETGPLEARHAELLRESLDHRLQEVGKKSPKKPVAAKPPKKSPKKAKKATPKGPSKRELKVKELQAELKATYSIESTTATVSELRKEIAAAKKAQKSVAKAKKVAASPKSPGKRELKVKELQDELKTTYGIESTTANVSELRKEIAAAKKAQKAKAKATKDAKKVEKAPKVASKPKGSTGAAGTPPMSKRGLKKMELFAELKSLGGDLSNEKPISEYSTAEIRAAIKAVTPKKKTGKKAAASTKKPVVKKSQKDLIAELVGAPNTVELDNECTVASITTSTGGSNGEVVANTFSGAATADVPSADESAHEEAPEKDLSNVELEEEEIDEDELIIEDDSSDDEEDEAEFPGMERVEEFEHESRPGETLYKDEDGNIWNDEQELVGSYDEDEDCIIEE